MKIIVCGIGNLGHRVVGLLQEQGETVTAISLAGSDTTLSCLGPSCDLVTGDARDSAVLKAAGVTGADVFMALTGDDMVNLEMAIAARGLNERMSIITRMFDDQLSHEIQRGFGIQKALSASHLAVPSFIAAALNETTLFSFDCNGRDTLNHIHKLSVGAESPLSGMTVAAAESSFGMKVVLCRRNGGGQDAPFVPGDRLIISSFDRSIAARLVGARERSVRRRIVGKSARRRFSPRDIPRNVRIILASYLALLALAVAVFAPGLDISLVDALYFTVTTTTTVGYGDINLQHAPAWLKIFGSVIMIAGAAALAALFSIMTDVLISRRFSQFFGMSPRRLRDHIVVTGLGNIGYRVVAHLLEAGERIVAIEKNPDSPFLAALRGRVSVIFGNALHAATMEQAGITRARAILALTDDDLANLNIVLNARAGEPDLHAVARIFSASIGDKARDVFDIPAVLSTSAIAAPVFVGAALDVDIVYAFLWESELFLVVAMKGGRCGIFAGMLTPDVGVRHGIHPFLVLENGRWELITTGRPCRDDDEFMALGTYADFKRFHGAA